MLSPLSRAVSLTFVPQELEGVIGKLALLGKPLGNLQWCPHGVVCPTCPLARTCHGHTRAPRAHLLRAAHAAHLLVVAKSKEERAARLVALAQQIL